MPDQITQLRQNVADLTLQVKSLQRVVDRLVQVELKRQGKTVGTDHNSSIFHLASKEQR